VVCPSSFTYPQKLRKASQLGTLAYPQCPFSLFCQSFPPPYLLFSPSEDPNEDILASPFTTPLHGQAPFFLFRIFKVSFLSPSTLPTTHPNTFPLLLSSRLPHLDVSVTSPLNPSFPDPLYLVYWPLPPFALPFLRQWWRRPLPLRLLLTPKSPPPRSSYFFFRRVVWILLIPFFYSGERILI